MSPQRQIVQYFLDKLKAAGYTDVALGYGSPRFGRGASRIEIWIGQEQYDTTNNAQLPPEGEALLEFYVLYYVGDEHSGEWYDYTQGVIDVICDAPADRSNQEWMGWEKQTIQVDRHTSLRRFDNAQEDSEGFAVARIDVPITFLTRGPR
jgi:hypothetical protein